MNPSKVRRIATLSLALAGGMVIARGFHQAPANEEKSLDAGAPRSQAHQGNPADPSNGRVSGLRPPVARQATGETFRQSWDLLKGRNRIDVASLLLAEWIKTDPDGALEAALNSDEYPGMLDLFQELLDKDPTAFRHRFDGERFGLKTAEVRVWWISRMAAKDPDALLASAGEFGPVDNERAVRSALSALSGDPVRMWQAVGKLAALPDSAEQRKQWNFAAMELAGMVGANELVQRLSGISGAAGDVMISHAMVALLEKTDYQGARQTYGNLPADLKPQIVKAALENPGHNAQAFLAAIDEVVNTPQWKDLQTSVAVNLHEMPKGGNQQAALLAWATALPEREDTMDLYRVAVRTFMSNQPEAARDWIAAQPAGWKQQNALAAYVQTSLAARDDVAGAQWASRQISDPRFLRESEGFFAYHARKQGGR